MERIWGSWRQDSPVAHCPLPALVIVHGVVSINADDPACSECECFPPEQKVILIQIDAGHVSTLLTYKHTLLCCLKCWTSTFKISFELNLAQSSSTCIHLKWICFLYLFFFGFSKSWHSKCSFMKSLLLPPLPIELGLLTLPLPLPLELPCC